MEFFEINFYNRKFLQVHRMCSLLPLYGQGSKIAYFLAGPVRAVVRISAIPTSHHAVPPKNFQTRHKALFPLLKTFRFDKYIYTSKEVVLTVEKRDVLIVLPYLGFLSLQVRTRLEKVFKKCLPCCKLRVVFKSSVRISNFFQI